ncbi:thioredoxin family protein [Mangrovibacillus cuniculi]|uniref:Thioredoxin family protein n=1 Tax=Mangrovibacillus cuniculi TaxID=2593652 RepID=A0A7S8CCG2_9BACI|nr:thioredoxin family protein [Mangrovibacillus cuniculi]QPC47424.1 thioredoxin family protein [Mangrovibacillus cuniculi]
MKPINTEENYRSTIEQDQPVIIKFHADWCPDCRRMDMFIDDIMADYNQYQWFDINRDELPSIAEEQQVMGIPSLLVFKNGEKLAHLHSANAKTPEQVREFLSSL